MGIGFAEGLTTLEPCSAREYNKITRFTGLCCLGCRHGKIPVDTHPNSMHDIPIRLIVFSQHGLLDSELH